MLGRALTAMTGPASPCNTQLRAGTVEVASCVYFPIVVAQVAQGGGEAEQQGQRNVCVRANLGN